MAVSFTSRPAPSPSERSNPPPIARSKDSGVSPVGVAWRCATRKRASSSAGAKGFGDVVVRAVVQGCDFVFFAVAHRKNNDRNLAPFAQALENSYAVHVRKPKIQQDDLGVVLGCLGDAFLARGGFQNTIAISFQADPQRRRIWISSSMTSTLGLRETSSLIGLVLPGQVEVW